MANKSGQGAPGKRTKLKDGESFIAIKMTLNQVIRREHSASFRQRMLEKCMAATRFQCLASLLLLYKVNTAIDDLNDNFFEQNGKIVIRNCFMGINKDNVNNPMYGVPAEFRALVEQKGITLPTRTAMSNSFTYMCELYTQNLQTNLRRWCYRRVRTFYRMKGYELQLQGFDIDETDIRNALRAVFLGRDGTEGDPRRVAGMHMLVDELYMIGGNGALDMRTFMDNTNWFKSLRMWLLMQRAIEEFNINHSPLQFCGQRLVPKPPTIKNFTAIPLCSFKLKHIRIDDTEFKEIAKLKMFKTEKAVDTTLNKDDTIWNSIFDLNHVNRIGKQHKKFHHQFLTDSVSVSLMYVKKERPTDADIVNKISDDFNMNQIVYELGIDPGMRTWNATVRRTVRTNKEVSFINKSIVFSANH